MLGIIKYKCNESCVIIDLVKYYLFIEYVIYIRCFIKRC